MLKTKKNEPSDTFASGAKGLQFESERAYHPPSENQSLTEKRVQPWSDLTDCCGSILNDSDQQLTSSAGAGQTVMETWLEAYKAGLKKLSQSDLALERRNVFMYRWLHSDSTVHGAAYGAILRELEARARE